MGREWEKRYLIYKYNIFFYSFLSADKDHVIIVISSLTRDMNSKIDAFRANAIRVLCRITDVSSISFFIKKKNMMRGKIIFWS